MDVETLRAATAKIVAEAAYARFMRAAFRLEMALKYNPNWPSQPRVPAGNPDGGQWTDGDGGTIGTDDGIVRLVQAEAGQGYDVDLVEEEAVGGHAIRTHVGRTPESLLARVRGERYFFGLFAEVRRKRDGSFPSVTAANKLVNATLSRNRSVVEKVARGELDRALVTSEFRSKTGIEAFGERGTPRLRDTYGVGVVIVHDPNSGRGFRVITAYPRSD